MDKRGFLYTLKRIKDYIPRQNKTRSYLRDENQSSTTDSWPKPAEALRGLNLLELNLISGVWEDDS